jgi:hypothetical protein
MKRWVMEKTAGHNAERLKVTAEWVHFAKKKIYNDKGVRRDG